MELIFLFRDLDPLFSQVGSGSVKKTWIQFSYYCLIQSSASSTTFNYIIFTILFPTFLLLPLTSQCLTILHFFYHPTLLGIIILSFILILRPTGKPAPVQAFFITKKWTQQITTSTIDKGQTNLGASSTYPYICMWGQGVQGGTYFKLKI